MPFPITTSLPSVVADRTAYIRRSRVPSPEIYSSISEAFRTAHADETKIQSIEVLSALGGVEVGWIAVLVWGVGWFSSESAVVLLFQMRGLDTTFSTRCDGRVLTVPLKGYWYSSGFVCTKCNLTDSHAFDVLRDHP